ncbi:MAG: InlB B-repeat-containing protein, partial [Spirochaetales bacterium]|nr:InlB B-repeat-containing protein [Spirochaetales bacterium]
MKKFIGFITIVMMLIGLIACDTEQSGSIEGNVSANTGNNTSNQSGDDSSSSASDSSSSSDDSSSASSQSGDDSSSSASDSSSSDDSSSASSQSGDDSSSSQEPPIIQYTVVFDANGGTGEMANQTFIYDESQDLNNCSFTPPTGHQFGGWNTAANGQGDTFADSAAVKNLTAVNNGSVTLYAQWVANQYQITYKDENNQEFSGIPGANHPTVYTYDQSAALDTPHRNGYEFAGYHLRSDCSDDAITALAASTYTDDITLYAKWISG